jgi:hypothetical protein
VTHLFGSTGPVRGFKRSSFTAIGSPLDRFGVAANAYGARSLERELAQRAAIEPAAPVTPNGTVTEAHAA